MLKKTGAVDVFVFDAPIRISVVEGCSSHHSCRVVIRPVDVCSCGRRTIRAIREKDGLICDCE